VKSSHMNPHYFFGLGYVFIDCVECLHVYVPWWSKEALHGDLSSSVLKMTGLNLGLNSHESDLH